MSDLQPSDSGTVTKDDRQVTATNWARLVINEEFGPGKNPGYLETEVKSLFEAMRVFLDTVDHFYGPGHAQTVLCAAFARFLGPESVLEGWEPCSEVRRFAKIELAAKRAASDTEWAERVLGQVLGTDQDPALLEFEAAKLTKALDAFERGVYEHYGAGTPFVSAAVARHFGPDYVLGGPHGPDPAGEMRRFAELEQAASDAAAEEVA